MKTDTNKINYYLCVKSLVFILIIVVVFIKSINLKMPGTTVDEFGYMSYAANLSGWDWTSIMKYHPFYGIGTSLLWVPIFFLFSGDSGLIYQSIVVFNGVLLAGSFLISEKSAKILFPDISYKKRLLTCTAILFYPAYIFYTQVAISEILLYFLFWLSFYYILKLLQTPRTRDVIALAIIEGYMLLVHLRTVPVIAITVIFMVYLCYRKHISWKKCVLFIFLIGMSVLVWYFLKSNYYSNLGEINSINQRNTQFNIIEQFELIFNNLFSYIERMGTRIFYFLCTGGIVFWSAILYLLKEVTREIRKIRKKELIDISSIWLYLLVIIFVNFFVFVLQGFGTPSRLDVVVYGRYVENLMGPILLLGVYCISTKQNWSSIAVHIYLLFVILLTPFVLYQMEESATNIFAIDSAVGFGAFFTYDMENLSIDFALLKTICSVIFFNLMCTIINKIGQHKKIPFQIKKCVRYIPIICVICFWIYLELSAESQFNSKRSALFDEYTNIAEQIDGDKDIVYVRQNNSDDCTSAKYLQYLMEDSSIEISNYDDIKWDKIADKIILYKENGEHFSDIEKRFSNELYTSQFVIFSN